VAGAGAGGGEEGVDGDGVGEALGVGDAHGPVVAVADLGGVEAVFVGEHGGAGGVEDVVQRGGAERDAGEEVADLVALGVDGDHAAAGVDVGERQPGHQLGLARPGGAEDVHVVAAVGDAQADRAGVAGVGGDPERFDVGAAGGGAGRRGHRLGAGALQAGDGQGGQRVGQPGARVAVVPGERGGQRVRPPPQPVLCPGDVVRLARALARVRVGGGAGVEDRGDGVADPGFVVGATLFGDGGPVLGGGFQRRLVAAGRRGRPAGAAAGRVGGRRGLAGRAPGRAGGPSRRSAGGGRCGGRGRGGGR
jgi:hypothetical protein